MLKIKSVVPGGIGAELGLVPGDIILSFNEKPARDILDYCFHATDEKLCIRVKKNREIIDYEIEKDYQDDLGLEFELRPRQCRNKCIFCFVDQMPPHLRRTLYIKDDDYRLSFLHGNYITLTNLDNRDIQRIIDERLSPLYISVHASNPRVRARLLGKNSSIDIMELLNRFARAKIAFHGQIVLCPGYNDGPVLQQTLTDLAELGDSVLSLAVVPVGLTRHRNHLTPLAPVTREIAREVIAVIAGYQQKFLKELGRRTVYAADEFFIVAEQPVPGPEYYEDFAQLENGIGLIRKALMQAESLRALPPRRTKPGKVLLVTGLAARDTLDTAVPDLQRVLPDLTFSVLAVENHLLGPQITVAGLLAGADILAALRRTDADWDILVVPETAVRAGCFIDDCTTADLARELDKPVCAAADFLDLTEILIREVK
ncbi:MAG: DUF512 domain-containing protein [Firmicutes bacterium]|nr:DUF512 domain-containing protein [Bacillota bacterium]HOB34145.1 DUF512 domain-containing protein [Bacillota bacterium]HPZ90643.1 DUF512 domain-containing protein [Bacillota bacterium]HQE02261.1 DUF512 domain-containing protein [Bacillota bacterium]